VLPLNKPGIYLGAYYDYLAPTSPSTAGYEHPYDAWPYKCTIEELREEKRCSFET